MDKLEAIRLLCEKNSWVVTPKVQADGTCTKKEPTPFIQQIMDIITQE